MSDDTRIGACADADAMRCARRREEFEAHVLGLLACTRDNIAELRRMVLALSDRTAVLFAERGEGEE